MTWMRMIGGMMHRDMQDFGNDLDEDDWRYDA